MTTARINLDGLSVWPRGLSRPQSAMYVGVSPTKFDELVRDGRMPGPKRIDGRVVWDKIRLDEAFGSLPDDGACKDENPWDTDLGGANEDHNAGQVGRA
jgi:predicted DNA-binding transcriptional regulator AlpA